MRFEVRFSQFSVVLADSDSRVRVPSSRYVQIVFFSPGKSLFIFTSFQDIKYFSKDAHCNKLLAINKAFLDLYM